MKKLILLLSVLSIFLIPSFSFAQQTSNYYSYSENNSLITVYTNGSFYLSSFGGNPFIFSTGTSWVYQDGVLHPSIPSKEPNTYLSSVSIVNNSSFLSTVNIYNDSTLTDVFFSVPLVQVAEELPPVILQHGGTVLSVVLTGFGLLLAVLSIPQLVKRFLY